MKMFRFKVIFVLSVILAYCKSASIVDNVTKCGLLDGECQKKIYLGIIQGIGDAGIPDMGIPAIDPYKLHNVELSIMGMVKITLLDGWAKGIKSCHSTKFLPDVDKFVTSVELECDVLSVDTTYNIKSTPTLESLIGGIKIHGEGKGGVIIEKMQVNAEIPFEIKKLEDCQAHFVIINDRVSYTFKILGKMQFNHDNLYIGSQEISTAATNIVNENWQFVSSSMAKSVLDVVVDRIIVYMNKLLATIPITDIISEDVTSLISV